MSRLPPHQDFVLELCDGGRHTHTHTYQLKNPGFQQQEAQTFLVNTLLEMKASDGGKAGGAILLSVRLLGDGR